MKSIASRLWPEPVRLALSPGHAEASRLSRLRAGKRLHSESGDFSEPGWKTAVAQMVPLIAALGVARASGTVVLSNRFVRYLLLPSSPALRTPADWQAFARQRLADLHGNESAHWSLLLSSAGRTARLACAVETALIEGVREALGGAGHRLAALRPRFAAWFDGGRRRAGAGGAWFVDHDHGQLTLGLAMGGEWRSFRQRHAGPQWQAELGSLLDREAELCGAAPAVDKAFVAASAGLPDRLGRYAIFGIASA